MSEFVKVLTTSSTIGHVTLLGLVGLKPRELDGWNGTMVSDGTPVSAVRLSGRRAIVPDLLPERTHGRNPASLAETTR